LRRRRHQRHRRHWHDLSESTAKQFSSVDLGCVATPAPDRHVFRTARRAPMTLMTLMTLVTLVKQRNLQIVGRRCCAPHAVIPTPPPLRPLRHVGRARYESEKRSTVVPVMGRALKLLGGPSRARCCAPARFRCAQTPSATTRAPARASYSTSDQASARSTASRIASGSLSLVTAKSTCARVSCSRLKPLSTAE